MDAKEGPPKVEIPACMDSEYPEVSWAVPYVGEKFKPITIPRPKVTDHTVKFEMLYCGVCHSDCHTGRNEWAGTKYPYVGGHELLGKVTEIGSKVTKFKVGDTVGVGCFIDACLDCEMCKSGNEQYCLKGMTGTYNGVKKHGRVAGNQDLQTFGGYSGSNVVHEDFIIKIPDGMDITKASPILCAGITMYSPLVHWNCKNGGKTVGIVGVGGLGTMGIKLAKALGNDVVAISTSAKKEQLAKDKGASKFVVSTSEESMKANAGTCDVILNTVSASHQLQSYLPLLKKGGTLVQLGGVTTSHTLTAQLPLMFNRWSIGGSLIGGIRETQEVIDLCHQHNIYPDCQMIHAKQLDWAWEELCGEGKNPDGIRYVIDIKASLEDKDFLPQ